MHTIQVGTESSGYEILIGEGLLEGLPSWLERKGFLGRPVVVTNTRIRRLHGQRLLKCWKNESIRPVFLTIPEGESAKTLPTAAGIFTRLIKLGADRQTIILTFGGGVIGDLAGFVAATYLRGVPLIQLPTTLLSQIDSSVGGKVGVNHPLGKNLIGAFYPPRLVLADGKVLSTLPKSEWRSGLFEAVKYGMIAGRKLFRFFENHLAELLARDPDTVTEMIRACVKVKADVVAQDERESGLRMILNFGHTGGHALEAATRYRRLKHGEAVGWGMVFAIRCACGLGILPVDEARRMESLIRAVGLPVLPKMPARHLLEAMRQDKKRQGSALRLVLPVRIGKVSVQEGVEEAFLLEMLREAGLAL